MNIVLFIGGVLVGTLIGLIIVKIAHNRQKIHGYIEVDHKTSLCDFHITSAELSNPKTKTAIFAVFHNVDLSRKEQSL